MLHLLSDMTSKPDSKQNKDLIFQHIYRILLTYSKKQANKQNTNNKKKNN